MRNTSSPKARVEADIVAAMTPAALELFDAHARGEGARLALLAWAPDVVDVQPAVTGQAGAADDRGRLMETFMDIRPIRNDEDHRAALAEIDACWGAREGTEKGDKLDVRAALVESYEARRWPIKPAEDFDPVDVLHHAIDELGHSQTEVAALLGSRSRASEVLARKRALTVDMIHKIGEAWKIPADLLVRPYKIEKAA